MVRLEGVELTDAEARAAEGRGGHYIRIDVRDDGAGMAPDVLARVFEPFFTTKPADRGTGLGLSMVDGVVRQSGGFVRLESAPGEGTTVAIFLPLVEEPVTPAAEVPLPRPGAGERVLVVDDEAALRSLACRVLEQSGYRVFQAPNGVAALNYVAAHPGAIDLVLTDIVMPWMNGLELAAGLEARAPDVPVLFMTGYADDEILRRGTLPAGASILQKPVTPAALTEAVRDALDRARRAHPSTT